MTPAEVAAILRQFNEWRRSDYEPSEQPAPPDPREIGEAIDSAVEMIDRLEAAEKDIALKERVIDALGSELAAVAKERDALRAKIEAMEKHEPVAEWIENKFDQYPQLVWDEKYKAVVGTKLYVLPGAKGE